MVGADQQGAAAGELLEKVEGPLGKLGIGGDHLPGPRQQLGQGAQHLRPAGCEGGAAMGGKGGAGAGQEMLQPLAGFIPDHNATAPAVAADLQGAGSAGGIEAEAGAKLALIGSGRWGPGDAQPVAHGLTDRHPMGGHEHGNPGIPQGRDGRGDGFCLAAAHGRLEQHEGGLGWRGKGACLAQVGAGRCDLIGSPQAGQHRQGRGVGEGLGEGIGAGCRGQVIEACLLGAREQRQAGDLGLPASGPQGAGEGAGRGSDLAGGGWLSLRIEDHQPGAPLGAQGHKGRDQPL